MSGLTGRAQARPTPRAPGKRLLDVEDALRWTYRDELPKREGGGLSISNFTLSPLSIGVVTSDGGYMREPGFPRALGDPHPDAVVIGQKVKELERFRDHALSEPGLNLAHCGIDEAMAVRAAMPTMIVLLQRFARMAARPHAGEVGPVREPVKARNGAPLMVRRETRWLLEGRLLTRRHKEALPFEVEVPVKAIRAGVYPPGSYAQYTWTPNPEQIARARAEYLVWWAGLDALAQDLSGKLTSITVLAPSAPPRPWAGDRELGKPAAVFSALRTPAQAWRHKGKSGADAMRRRAPRRAIDPRASTPSQHRVEPSRKVETGAA